jgi:hypothetical protein
MLKERLYPYSVRVQQHQNHLIWLRNEKNIEKMFDDKYMFADEQFYLIT